MKGSRKPISTGERWRFRLEVAAFRAVAWLVPKFSRQATIGIGRALGSLAYCLAPGLRRIALANLDVAFADSKAMAEKRRITRASLQTLGGTLLGLFWLPRLTPENFRQVVEVDEESLAHVRNIRAQGRGIIFIALHYGDWELLGLATGFLDIPVTVVQETMRNQALPDLLAKLRGRSGHNLIASRHAAVKLVRTLEQGGCTALLIDQFAPPRLGGVWVDFFGLPVLTTSLVARLALRSGAAIVGGAAHPLDRGRIRIVYGPEIECTRTGDEAGDVRAISQKCLTYCENIIRERPDHWLWSYKRWKARPSPAEGRYPYYSRYLSVYGVPQSQLPQR